MLQLKTVFHIVHILWTLDMSLCWRVCMNGCFADKSLLTCLFGLKAATFSPKILYKQELKLVLSMAIGKSISI